MAVYPDDLTGIRFGRLVAVERAGTAKYGRKTRTLWRCKCDCGDETEVARLSLVTDHTKSCGCIRLIRNNHTIHGHGANNRRSPTYRVWVNLRNRACRGRHIPCDPRWGKFLNFLEDMGERPKGAQIDRIDNSLGYTKSNCRWVTRTENVRNRTNTLCVNDVPLASWAERLGVPYKNLYFQVVTMGRSLAQATLNIGPDVPMTGLDLWQPPVVTRGAPVQRSA